MSVGGKRRLERWPTGEAHFDAMLRGGLPRGYLSLILGPTGSGKSMFAHQLSRLAGNRALYLLTSGVQAEATDALFADPCPVYVDLTLTLLEEGIEAVFTRIAHSIDTAQAEMVLIDSLDPLLGILDNEWDRRKAIRRLVDMAWRANLTIVAFGRDAYGELLDAAVLVMELLLPDKNRPRRLEIAKYVGSDYLQGDHAVRIGPLGLSFDAGAPQSALSSMPVTGLGARILNAFRTAKAATAAELADLLGHDLDAVETALETLGESGYLAIDRGSEDHEPIYALPMPG